MSDYSMQVLLNPYAITKKVNEVQAPPDSVGMRFFNVWAEEGSRKDMLYRMLQEGTAKYLTRHRRVQGIGGTGYM